MKPGVRFVCVLLGALVLLFAPFQAAFAQGRSQPVGKVYLMRGLANVFSLGMDTLAEKLRQRGIDAQVYEYGQWPQLASDAVAWSKARYKAPVVIIGHSLGADAAVEMAERMTSLGIAPRLVITFDPVGVTEVGASGGRFINYYQSNNGFGKRLVATRGFTGKLVNRNLDDVGSIDHFNIEKADTLHAEVIKEVSSVIRRPRPRPPAAPAVAAPSTAPAATPAATPASAGPESSAAVQAVAQPAVR